MNSFTKRVFRIAAWTAVFGCIVWVTLMVLRARSLAEGNDLPWLADDAVLPLTANGVAAFAMLTCWVGSVVVWARSSRRGISHSIAIVGLILFGLFVGALYILVALRTVPEVRPDEAAA